ncbi:Protein arginine N-methyltransferase [Mycena indigotica]|uniref:Protein arginine N-methyltransferase n=1 Tax=Mycena indigotica TaxID=2126181 RepID=A0A8H6SDR3_9AGAR|nr:Protein arginine N-methyltransferase [Mycena indigotica]KAF7296880.1 Protein arginine N-methyltransferase [Mycena indigotica]
MFQSQQTQNNSFSSESLAKPDHPVLPQLRTRRILWPLFIVIGQLSLMIFALGLLLIVRAHVQIPMGALAVEFFEINPQLQTYIFTTLATALSLFSSFLFTQAVTHGLIVALTHPLRISTLGFGVRLSKKSLILDMKYKYWALASAAIFLLGLGQTPGWSSLLTPGHITVYVNLTGIELDLNQTSVQLDISKSWDNQLFPIINDINVLPSLLEAGSVSVTASAGHAAIIEFGGFTYSGSTNGVTGINLRRNNTNSLKATLPSIFDVMNTSPFPPSTDLSNAKFVMQQQGVFVNVSCQYYAFEALASRQQISRTGTVFPVPTLNADNVVWRIQNECGNEQGKAIFTDFYNNTWSLVACESGNTFDQPVFNMIIDGQGRYPGDFACSMTTVIGDTIANYTAITDGYTIIADYAGSSLTNIGPMGYAAFNSTKNAFGYAQSADGNIIGDTLRALLSHQGTTSEELNLNEDQLNQFARALEAYLSGVTELTATIVKANLAYNLESQGLLTPDKIRNITGYAMVDTIGWQYKAVSSNIVIIPIFIFGFLTIGIAVVAQYYNNGVLLSHSHFDPNDPWSIMAAAAAGGMEHIFPGVQHRDIEQGLELKIQLGQVEGRDGFVEGNQ